MDLKITAGYNNKKTPLVLGFKPAASFCWLRTSVERFQFSHQHLNCGKKPSAISKAMKTSRGKVTSRTRFYRTFWTLEKPTEGLRAAQTKDVANQNDKNSNCKNRFKDCRFQDRELTLYLIGCHHFSTHSIHSCPFFKPPLLLLLRPVRLSLQRVRQRDRYCQTSILYELSHLNDVLLLPFGPSMHKKRCACLISSTPD